MNQNNNAYCQLEGFYRYGFEDKDKQESCSYNQYIYVKEMHDLDSIKQQIIKSTKAWHIKYPERERYWSDEEWKENMRYGIKDEDRDSYPGLVIRNRWGKSKYVGFCYKGW